jgi:hypothetical protein
LVGAWRSSAGGTQADLGGDGGQRGAVVAALGEDLARRAEHLLAVDPRSASHLNI